MDGLPQERQQLDVTLEILDTHIDEAVVDFNAVYMDAMSDAAGRIHDVECRVPETVRDMARQ